MKRRRPRYPQDRRRGAVAVEFALVGPIFVLMLIAGVVYGAWLMMAQSVQALAAEGARAAVAGLDPEERERLARAEVEAAVGQGGLDPDRATVQVIDDETRVEVVVAYDVRDHPLILLGGMLPRPPGVIERSAVVRIGGYD